MPRRHDLPPANPVAALFVLVLNLFLAPARGSDQWPDFRGPTQDGHSDATGLPLTWSETEHVKWKTPIPGRAWSSPVVSGNQVWITTAPEDGSELFAVALGRRDGKIIHNIKLFDVSNQQKMNRLNSFATPSPVIEPGRVYLHFGTYGTACLDSGSGSALWTRRDLNIEHQEGPGSSPVLWRNLLVFNCDGTNAQFVVALDKSSGRTVWKRERSRDFTGIIPHKRKAFSTPLIVQAGGMVQMISVGAEAIYGYAPADGSELWRFDFDGFTVAPRPVAGFGMVFFTTGYDHPSLVALRLGEQFVYDHPSFMTIRSGERGGLAASNVVWRAGKQAPIRSSPVIASNLVYMVSDGGVASALDALSGEVVWSHRLGVGEEYSASPVFADGRLYFFGQNGSTYALKPGRQYEELAVNRLDSGFMASPAIAGHAFFVRTRQALYRLEN
jgi:outer membrane protein assembly factor BamB